MDRMKYRGKIFDSDTWVFGSAICSHGQIAIAYDNEHGNLTMQLVDPGTVGQCTGLKHHNGKLIYEGDIVMHNCDIVPGGKTNSEVYWDDELCEFGYRNSNDLFHGQFQSEREIIGNIHDNPELLEVAK